MDRTKLWRVTEELPENMAKDPVKPETYKLARKYATDIEIQIRDALYPIYDDKVATALPEELRLVAIFNATVL